MLILSFEPFQMEVCLKRVVIFLASRLNSPFLADSHICQLLGCRNLNKNLPLVVSLENKDLYGQCAME